jgi:hypothetical protein
MLNVEEMLRCTVLTAHTALRARFVPTVVYEEEQEEEATTILD